MRRLMRSSSAPRTRRSPAAATPSSKKYLHDLDSWDALPVEAQEQAIGRTKLSDIELADEDKPPNSHLAINTILDENGTEHQIMRLNMPFGEIGKREFGTYFISYARAPDVIEQMLSNMFIGRPPGNHDRILDFSTALTGNLFFVPSSDFLDDPPELSATATTPVADSPGSPHGGSPPSTGSLGIGSLRQTTP